LIASALIHRSSNPGALLILCANGLVAGIALFAQGFRLLQRRRLILDARFSKIRNAAIDQRIALQSNPRLQVVRLSPEPAPTKAQDMSQQQKIAAAMLRAGIANPAAWATEGFTEPANLLTKGLTGEAAGDANVFDSNPPVVLEKDANNQRFILSWRSQEQVARSLGWKCALMIGAGAALALLSLYFLLRLKSTF
jgi:hypothetical protein